MSQESYVGIWVCGTIEDGLFYQIDYNFVAVQTTSIEPERGLRKNMVICKGWFEDNLSRIGNRKQSVYTKSFEEAMFLVTADIEEHKLSELTV